jgi:hypothetical protein
MWLFDDTYTETTPASGLSCFALGAIIAVGLASQSQAEHSSGGVQQASSAR